MSSVIERLNFFREYDFVRLRNIMEHNRSILFDYVRLKSIKNLFAYVPLPTSPDIIILDQPRSNYNK